LNSHEWQKDESEARKVEKVFMLRNLSTAKQPVAVTSATDVLRGRSRKGDKTRNVLNESKTVPNANDTYESVVILVGNFTEQEQNLDKQ